MWDNTGFLGNTSFWGNSPNYLSEYSNDSIFKYIDAYNRFSLTYNKLASEQDPVYSAAILSQLKNEIHSQLEELKRELVTFKNQILEETEKLEVKDSANEELFNNQKSFIKELLACRLSVESIGSPPTQLDYDFYYRHYNYAEISDSVNSLFEVSNNYARPDLISKLDEALQLRETAEKIYHQKNAIDELLKDIIASNYPEQIDNLNPESDEDKARAEKILNKKKSGKKTPQNLLEDISLFIGSLPTSKMYYHEDGSLNINQAVLKALDDRDFYRKWGRKEKDHSKEGYSERHLKTLFKQVFNHMKDSNSS